MWSISPCRDRRPHGSSSLRIRKCIYAVLTSFSVVCVGAPPEACLVVAKKAAPMEPIFARITVETLPSFTDEALAKALAQKEVGAS